MLRSSFFRSHSSLPIAFATCGVFLAAMDQTVILTSIPQMLLDVHVSLSQLDKASWIVTGYLLGYLAVMPLMSRVSDLHGRRPIFMLALGIFGAGSLACAGAGALPALVGARVIQAIGGGALLPVALALVADLRSGPERALVLGAVGAAAEAGGVLGPLYGAEIVQLWGWRWIFWLNLPLVLLIALACWFGMRSLDTTRFSSSKAQVDYAGAVLFAAAVTAMTVGLSGSSNPLRSASPIDLRRAVPLTIAAMVLGAGFVWRQRRTPSPLLPLRLFRRRGFSAANSVNFLAGIALIAAMVDVPLFVATVLARSPVESGLALLRLTAFIPAGAVAGGWLMARLGPRVVAVGGLALATAGFFWMSGWNLQLADSRLTRDLAAAGLGFGLVIAPVTWSVLDAVGEMGRALSTAVVTVMRMAGMTVGLAGLTSFAFYRFNQLVAHLALPIQRAGESAQAFSQRFQAYQSDVTNAALAVFTAVFLIAGCVCLAACLPALLLPGRSATAQPR